MFLFRRLIMSNPTKCGVTFTSIYSPKVAKSYEIEAGKLVKKAADTLKTGSFKTVSVNTMVDLRDYMVCLMEQSTSTEITSKSHPTLMSLRLLLGKAKQNLNR